MGGENISSKTRHKKLSPKSFEWCEGADSKVFEAQEKINPEIPKIIGHGARLYNRKKRMEIAMLLLIRLQTPLLRVHGGKGCMNYIYGCIHYV